MLLDITFNLNHLEISGTQIVNWFVYTIITASAGTIVKYQLSKYQKKKKAEAEEDRKLAHETALKIENISIDVQAIDYGLEKSPTLNGNYTSNRNEKRKQLRDSSLIIHEP